jgi:endonuclease/exonuclease/phosphatase family metal-dependent hydrolase
MSKLRACCFLLSLVGILAGPALPAEPASIAVLCFNIRYDNPDDGQDRWDLRREEVLAILRDGELDFIGLQEALPHQVGQVAAELPGYGLIVRSRESDPDQGEACPLFYRADRWRVLDSGTFWLAETSMVPGSRSWQTACPRIATWGRFEDVGTDSRLLVINTHFDHVSQAARENGARLLQAFIAEAADPVVVMGDFNAGPDTAALAILRGAGPQALGDAHADLPTGPGSGTFHGFNGQAGPERIDMILHSPSLAVAAATIDRRHRDGRYPSDHFPVRALLDLDGPGLIENLWMQEAGY